MGYITPNINFNTFVGQQVPMPMFIPFKPVPNLYQVSAFNSLNYLLKNPFNYQLNNYLNTFSFNNSNNRYVAPTFSFTEKVQSTPKTNTEKPSGTVAANPKDIQWWKNLGYNAQKGKELMNYMSQHVTGFTGNCVGVVREAINKVYYGGNKHYKSFGKACNVGRDFLSTDKHFKKVTGIELANIDPKDIPEGVVIIYGPGYSQKHPTCGHGEISNGNGKGYSDGISHIRNSGNRMIQELWIPV